MKNLLGASFLLIALLSFSAPAQTKKNARAAKPPPAVTAAPLPKPEPKVESPVKRNERPGGESSAEPKKNSGKNPAVPAYTPVYFFEFARPGFTYPRILIEHDDAGKGKISFMKDGFDELITDPIELSPVTMTNIRQTLTDLNFVDSTENYQYSKDFSNMGNNTFTVKKDGKERTAKYNWTDNKNAKILMDEYRRIGNEYTWKFEFGVARENQPLLTPGMMEALDSYIQRGEISDPTHLVPFLTQLSTDERLPLMARNRAAKLIKQTEKASKK